MKNYITVLFSIFLAAAISGCGGNGSKSSADINNENHAGSGNHGQTHDVRMGRLIAFKRGMDDSEHFKH